LQSAPSDGRFNCFQWCCYDRNLRVGRPSLKSDCSPGMVVNEAVFEHQFGTL
jgi:hypothetical protein